jgi:hypothetical protein
VSQLAQRAPDPSHQLSASLLVLACGVVGVVGGVGAGRQAQSWGREVLDKMPCERLEEVLPGVGALGVLLTRRARNALGTATQYTRRNDSPRSRGCGWDKPAARSTGVLQNKHTGRVHPQSLGEHGRGIDESHSDRDVPKSPPQQQRLAYLVLGHQLVDQSLAVLVSEHKVSEALLLLRCRYIYLYYPSQGYNKHQSIS